MSEVLDPAEPAVTGTPETAPPMTGRTTSWVGVVTTTLAPDSAAGLEVSCRMHVSRRASATDRPVFVLVHGIGMSHRYFRRLRDHLIDYGDTVLLDLPGFGGTPTPPRQLGVADYAAVIAAALDELRLRSCVVLGHSMGAQFATELAVQRPDLVAGVVLIGPVTDTAHPSALRNALSLGLDTLLERPMTNVLVGSAYAQCGTRWYRTELPVMLAYRLDDRMADVTQPVLVLRGALDPIATRAWCERLARIPARGRAIAIPGQAHAVHRTMTPDVATAVLTFTRSIPSAPQASPAPEPWVEGSPEWRAVTVGDRQCRAYVLEHRGTDRTTVGVTPVPSSPVFVLVHGIGMSHRYFLRLGRKLSQHGRVLVIDLPGYGWTRRPAHRATNTANAELLAALLDDLGVRSCTVVGHSMGVQTVTELALQRRDLVSHLVLIGAAVDAHRRTVGQQALTLGLNSVLEKPGLNVAQFLDVLRCGPRWYLAELTVAMQYRLEDRLPLATQPVLVLRGARDLVAGSRWSQSLAASSRDGTTAVVDRAPHSVHHRSPGLVAHHIIGFITSTGARARYRDHPRLRASQP